MAVALKYDIKGYNRVRNSLRKLASEYREETDSTIEDWTKKQRAELKAHSYPPQLNAPQPFKTERQRRWFFWALSTGKISVPYSRTGVLASSWRAVKSGWGHWLLENSAAYSALVVSQGNQSKYHEGHWWTADEIIAKDVKDLTEDLTENLVDLTDGMDRLV
ncbi:MAG: hypothetical protein KAJ19_15570 [Gammaproteobacteria bacterium]|nr:hypothetical protein [Gammaproteobacteria bacterium]